MQNKSSGRGGFTLIEVLVTLILLAVLAAAVFPVVTQQAEQGDPVKAAQDLGSIRSGIEQFQLNVRPSFPGDLEDLVYRVSDRVAGADADEDHNIGGTVFTSTQITKWDGPYVDVALAEAFQVAGGTLAFETGFGGRVDNDLTCYDGATNDDAGTTCVAGRDFVAAKITELSDEQFELLNNLIDGEAEDDATSHDTGKLRFVDDGDDTLESAEVVYYLAVPFRGN